MDKYPKYKDSGLEWIGEIPRHWKIIKTNILVENLDGKRIPLNSVQRSEMEGTIPYWGSNGIVDYLDRYIFNEDLVLIGEDGSPFFDNTKPVSFVTRGKVWINNHIHVLRCRSNVIPNWLCYSFNTTDYHNYITGSTRDKLTQSDLNRILHPVPNLFEQKLLAKYLDQQTSQIDSLIEKLQQKIELLKEYRTAIISQCVTKGLDCNVEMKDSGIEWIGEIPRHWSNLRLKYAITYNDEVLSESTDPEFEFRYIEIGDVDQFSGVGIGKRISFAESPSRARRILRVNDVLVSTVRTYLRAIGTISETEDNFVGSTGFCVLRATSHIIWSYLSNFVKTEYFVSALVANSQGVTYPAITPTDLVKLRMLLPPIEEQIQISQFLDQKTSQIDSLIEKLQQKIELQKEYRQSLISNVVTGKVRVPELAK